MHKVLVNRAVEILHTFPEIDKLVLYGSVARGDYRRDSDIDIAVVCDDFWRCFPADLEGFPAGLRARIENALKELQESSGIKCHVPLYWTSEFERGIELTSNRPGKDILNKVGILLYDSAPIVS